MINNLYLKFGKTLGAPEEVVGTTPLTVFVGPNNSGKSKVLQEICRFCTSGQISTGDVVLKWIEFAPIAATEASRRIGSVIVPAASGETLQPGHILVGKRGHRIQVPQQHLESLFGNPNHQSSLFCNWYLQFNTLMLDGQSRIGLVNAQSFGDLQQPAQSSLQTLFRDDAKRLEVRRITANALGVHFVIDPGGAGQLRVRLSPRPPDNAMEERGLHDEAVKFHAQAQPIEQSSDGVKAFTGIVTEIIAGDPEVLLIDEPEAFLHPSLAFTLGAEIARTATNSEKRIFVSTHSSQFVMGCIHAGVPVNIVRLTYRNGSATARVLKNEDILRLMRNPLLRSTNVIGGLFYEFVVVTEADADRAFYQEINERLLRYRQDLGIPNCLFINAQNKQTIPTILKPLRALGIPAAAIADIDVLKEGGKVWSNFLDGGFIPEIDKAALSTTRSAVKARFDEVGKEMKTQGGIDLLDGATRESANNLFDRLADYGLFAVRKGELESWLKNLAIGGHGPSWLVDVFERMGEDPQDGNYIKPGEGDVWDFIGAVKGWLVDPARKGIPS